MSSPESEYRKWIPSVAEILLTLGQEKRIDILHILLESDLGEGVTALSRKLSLSAPSGHKHLKVLKDKGLVTRGIAERRDIRSPDFGREYWIVRSKKRVSRLIQFIENEIEELVEVGCLMEKCEGSRGMLEKYRTGVLSEKEDYIKQGITFDSFLSELKKPNKWQLLDEDERKKVNYWSLARDTGVL